MDLNQWFDKGMTIQEYIDSMKKNKEGMLHIYESFRLPEDEDFFAKVKAKDLRVIALTEDWCGDAMLNNPILFKLAEKTGMEVRLLLRDDNLELMDQYLTNGKSRSIPIYIFIDEDGNEVAKWGPRAEKIQQFVDDARQELPPKDAANFEEKAKEVYANIGQTFQQREDFWLEVYESMKAALA